LFVATLIGVIVALATPQAGKQTKTFHGVWRDGFETAAFYEGFSAANMPRPEEAPDGWLSFAEGAWPSDSRSPDDPNWEHHALSRSRLRVIVSRGWLATLGSIRLSTSPSELKNPMPD